MTTSPPLNWIRELEASLVALDEKPQLGLHKPLNWEQLEKDFSELLKGKVSFTHSAKGWMAAKDVFSGIGAKWLSLAIDWASLQRSAFFITDEQNVKDLMAKIFNSEEVASYFYESSYVEGFYHYFAAEGLRMLEKQNFAEPLVPRLGSTVSHLAEQLGEESCFVIDVNMLYGGSSYWGRVVLTEGFRREWKESFAGYPPLSLSDEMKEKISVDINLEVANTRLTLADWKKIKTGDLIVLDHCSYDPAEHSGGIVLKLNERPLFRGRLKEGGIKITSYPVYEEREEAMAKELFNEDYDEDEDDEEDDDLFEGLTEDEDSEFEEEDMFAGLEKPKQKPPVKEPAPEVKKEGVSAKLAPTEESPKITAEELPIQLSVEVGKVRMTAADLMNLSPGNLIELDVTPEQGVDLVINGKKVGRGELIRIGDLLGVRVVSL